MYIPGTGAVMNAWLDAITIDSTMKNDQASAIIFTSFFLYFFTTLKLAWIQV